MDHLERAKELLETCEKSYNAKSGWVMVAACHALIYIAESNSDSREGGGRMSAITMDTVRDLIERHSGHVSGNAREFYNGAYAEIADELNAALGGGDKSRWHEMFGTPERAARTLADLQTCSLGFDLECDECVVYSLCQSGARNDRDALLEWLRGDA